MPKNKFYESTLSQSFIEFYFNIQTVPQHMMVQRNDFLTLQWSKSNRKHTWN